MRINLLVVTRLASAFPPPRWRSTGRPFAQQSVIKAANVSPPDLKIESGANAAHAASRELRASRTKTCSAPMPSASRTRPASRVKVDFVGWEDINQQTAVTANSGAGPDLIMGFCDAPHIYQDKLIELTEVADYLGKKYGGWMRDGAALRQEAGRQHLDRHTVRRLSCGPMIYRKSIVNAGRLRQDAGRHAEKCLDLCEKLKKSQQAGRLRARQRGRRRQRLRQLADVVARRVAAGREGRGHHQLERDDRRAELSQATLSDLHRRHGVVERRLQQPRLFGRRNRADVERRLALLLAEERSGDQGRSPTTPSISCCRRAWRRPRRWAG